MPDVNYAEFQQRIDQGRVTPDEAKRMGSTHKAYGWSCTPPGQWNDVLKASYREGYFNA